MKMFGMNCYKVVYETTERDVMNHVVLAKNIYKARKEAEVVCNKRKAKLVSVEKV